MTRRILQICPHDEAPFGELCVRYQEAAVLADATVQTVFLGTAQAAPQAGADYLKAPDLADTGALARHLTAYAGQNWDLLLCHRYRAYWAAARSAIRARRKLAVAHEFGFFDRWQRRLNRRLWGHSFAFAGVSPAVADELAEVCGSAMVLPNVMADDMLDVLLTRPQALAELALPDAPLTVGVVGRLHYKKRPQLALEAFELLRQAHPGARLIFLGDGDLAGDLADRAGAAVHLLGPVPAARRLYRAFDVLLHTCDVEAFGMVPLEAMAAGVPVVALADRGPGYVLGELGFYPTSDDAPAYAAALERALGADRDALAAAGRQRISEQFSVAALATQLRTLLA